MAVYTIQGRDFLKQREQYPEMVQDVCRARMAGEAQQQRSRSAGWRKVASVVAGAALAGLLLGVASSAQAASSAATAEAAASGRPAMVTSSRATEPYVDRLLVPADMPLTVYEQRMTRNESRFDPSVARIRFHPISPARRVPGSTAREKYLALKLRQLE